MNKMQNVNNNTFFNIIKGIIISFISTLILLTILSAILTYTDTSENIISPSVIVITATSILIGSYIVNIKIKRKGILNGAIIGGIYISILYGISSIINQQFSLNLSSIIMIVLGVIFGILGGIIGVNNKNA